MPLKKSRDLSFAIVDAEPLIPFLAMQIKQALAKYNINLRIEVITVDEYLKIINSKKFDIMIRSKFLDYPDGFSVLSYFRSNYSANTFFVEDKTVDRLLDESIGELDLVKRTILYQKIQSKVLSYNSIVPLVFGTDNLGLWSPKVEAVPPHPLGVQGLPFNALIIKD